MRFFPLGGALDLQRRGGAQCGVKGEVIGFAAGRAGLNVAPALTVGACPGAPAALFAGEFVEGGIQLARIKFFAGTDLLPALPPIPFLGIGRLLRLRLGLVVVRRFFSGFLG